MEGFRRGEDAGDAVLGADLLLETVRPAMYRENGFRIAELPIEATARELERRHRGVEQALSVGLPCPAGPGRALPLDGVTDGAALRAAMTRLRDPERRLMDELFWFWPHRPGEAGSDDALQALARWDVRAASAIWRAREREGGDDGVSTHNLAVLDHAVALDLEVAPEEAAQRWGDVPGSAMAEALRRWKLLFEGEGLWDRLAARMRDFGDPRLTAGLARRLRAALPLALLTINAQLARDAAERGDLARRHVRAMEEAGYGPGVADTALRRVLEPTGKRIRSFCKAADADRRNAGAARANRSAWRLIDQSAPLLQTVDSLLPPADPTRMGLHDEVAGHVNIAGVAYGEETGDWNDFLRILEVARGMAAGEAVQARIETNIETAKDNLLYATCWFCKQRPREAGAHLDVRMHGEVVRGGGKVRWRHTTITVPRCKVCKGRHTRGLRWAGGAILALALPFIAIFVSGVDFWRSPTAGRGRYLGLVVWMLVVWILLFFLVAAELAGGFLVAWLLGGPVLILIGDRVGRRLGPWRPGVRSVEETITTRPVSTMKDFPPVRERLQQGWRFGGRPPGV